MKKAFIALMAVALLAVPANATAHPQKPLVKNAAKYCKSLREQLGTEVFRQTYGGGSNAYGKCVSQRVHELRDARRAAKRECKSELQRGSKKLRHNSRSSFGKCVKQKVREATSDDDDAVLNAAKTCKAEREQIGTEAFATKYGSNHNKRNAFGKCVSQHSNDGDETDPEDTPTPPTTA